MNPIAYTSLYGQDRQGTCFKLSIEIGAPYREDAVPTTWRCPVRIVPLHPRLPDIAGADAFQALTLANRLAITLLEEFIRDGGCLLNEDGSDFPLAAYWPRD